MNCVEKQVQGPHRQGASPAAPMTIGRVANLTAAAQRPRHAASTGTAASAAARSAPTSAATPSTLPAAYATGKLTLRPFSIVTELIYDETRSKATGVRIVDAETNQATEYFARVIFLCASAIASTFILLNSMSDRFPNGFGNDSGELGHNLMDHHFRVGASGLSEGFGDRFYKGRRPNGIYIPRFRNLDAKSRAEGLHPRLRLPGRREPRQLGARHQGAERASAPTSRRS